MTPRAELRRLKHRPIVGFAFLDRRVIRPRSSRSRPATPNPADPFRGLYISDELALRARRRRRGGVDADERLADAAARLGLDLLDAAVLGRVRRARAQPALRPPVRVPAGRRHAQARRARGSSASLLAGDGRHRRRRARLLRQRRAAAAPRRAAAARGRRADARSAERPVKVADRLAAFLLGLGRCSTRRAAARLRRQPIPTHDPGPRGDGRRSCAALLARPSHLPIVVAGPDADALLATGLRAAAARCATCATSPSRDVMADAALCCALEGRPLVFDGPRATRAGRARAAAARDRRSAPSG